MSRALSSVLKKRIAALEEKAKQPKWTNGFIFIKPITVDEWEQHTEPMQAELLRHVRSDKGGPPNYAVNDIKAIRLWREPEPH